MLFRSIWLDKPNTPQCSQCYKWGHHYRVCRTRGSYCAICAEPHPTSSHPAHCMSDHTHGPDSPPCPNVRCINCGKPHEAQSPDCVWHANRSNEATMRSLMGQRRARQLRLRQSRREARRLGPPYMHHREESQDFIPRPLRGHERDDYASGNTPSQSSQHPPTQQSFLAMRHQGEAVRPHSHPPTPESVGTPLSDSDDPVFQEGFRKWAASFA